MAGSALQMREALDAEERWALLERIAASPQLRRATRLQELLYYLGKRSLKDHCEALHEQTVGVEVFGRPDGYDTSADNIVRTSVSELRKRVDAYFNAPGADEALIMEIPRWNYILVFKHREVHSATLPEPPAPPEAPTPVEPPPIQVPETRPEPTTDSAPSGKSNSILIAAWSLVILLSVGCLYFWDQDHASSARYESLLHSMYAWQYEPSVAEFWNSIFAASPDTDVVLADASFGLVQDISKESFSFDDYLNRSYISKLDDQKLSPETRAAVGRIVLWNMGSQDEFKLANRLLALDPLGKRIHLYNARDYMPDLSKRDNVVLIGGRISNPWDELFESRMNFTVKFDANGSIMVVNRAPAPGEQATYVQRDYSLQYCVIGFLPNPNRNGIVLLIEGTGAEATEAAGDFLLSESQLSSLKKTLHADNFPPFEVLLKVTSVQGTPLTATVEAFRAYPNLH